jgi:GTP cyclohydrolase III
MKKLILIVFFFAGISLYSSAQIGMPKLPGKITDIPASTNKISDNIGKEVGGITKTEEKGVKDATTGFLGDYNNLLPKMKTDPTGFTGSLNKLKADYESKLKLALGAAKFAKFAGGGTGSVATKVLNMLM